MIQAYFNYVHKRIRIHSDKNCMYFTERKKPGQRVLIINNKTIGDEFNKFEKKKYRFCSIAIFNGMWVIVDFDNQEFEEAVVNHIHLLLSKQYPPFRETILKKHC